ncbi:MAG: helix-turn-helix domain-containing protein [Sphaerochaetaceae bacterium]|nr:helix-turn-helix domain-containing protein [Sphaerochaetaceae bacterium]
MSEKKYIQSVDRSFDIIEFISKKRVTKLNEICEALHLKAPTAHALLQTLEHREYIQRVGKTQYSLGLNALKLGLLYSFAEETNQRIHSLLTQIVDKVDETAYFEFKIGEYNYFYDTVLSSHPLRVVPNESKYRKSAPTSAVAQIYLSEDTEFKYKKDLHSVEEGLNCMSIPYRSNGKITATITLSGPSSRFTERKMEEAYQVFLDTMEKMQLEEHI